METFINVRDGIRYTVKITKRATKGEGNTRRIEVIAPDGRTEVCRQSLVVHLGRNIDTMCANLATGWAL